MKAVGYGRPLPIGDPQSLLDFDAPKPEPKTRDLPIEVRAVSDNPVDTKVRRSSASPAGVRKILGWDVSGVVAACGPDCVLFRPGDEVFYAGAIDRQGGNSEFHLVDERIVGKKPRTLDFVEAAALPLTSITAWELIFDHFRVSPGKSGGRKSLLIGGGAAGVGSIVIQLARRLTKLTFIATASRPETQDWLVPCAWRTLCH